MFSFKLPEKNTPRWIIFSVDVGICLFSLTLSYLLRFDFSVPSTEADTFVYVFPSVLLTRIFTFYIFKTYQGIVRYTSTQDAFRIFLTITLGSGFLALFNPLSYLIWKVYAAPYSIIIIDYLITVFLMTSLRLMVKAMYLEMKNPSRAKRSVIIYGAGEAGIITKRTLDRDAGTKYKAAAFLDDDPRKHGKKMEGITIYPPGQLEKLLKENDVAHLIIAIQNVEPQRKKEIAEVSLQHNTKVLNVPPVSNWINGELSFKQIKKIKIEDLLEREPIQLDIGNIRKEMSGKRILITGAAGSIGSEITRQLIPFSPGLLILLDQAESALYDLELEAKEIIRFTKTEIVIGDVRNQERMQKLFDTFKPEVVFHAAAYKHVPLMENNPSEALLTNVYGTKIMADLSVKSGVEKFVMISTDKAVNPTNIMGASKRIAEVYTQSLGKTVKTKFITTRFGNVLGSNGSVIPRFKKQIEEGGPVTVTHPEITRFFMTIPEACQLVLEAGAMGKGGEIFAFDMGRPVKIADLARKMIQLSGLTIDKDIKIAYTGLRPGEKLYEEVMSENTLPTHHPKIMIGRVREYNFDEVSREIDLLITLFGKQNNETIVKKMKELVPEFISNNSVYEQLDEKKT